MQTRFTIEEPVTQHHRFALFRLGFRPFFLLGPVFSLFALFYFVAWMSGLVSFWPCAWDAVIWHRHEMLFGYTGAIIAGFLLTAVPNWTGQPTPKGLLLAALVAVWLLGRIAVFFSAYLPPTLVTSVDSAFFLLCALGILPALIKAKNTRNYMFIILLSGLSVANALTHTYKESDTYLANLGISIALNIIVLMMLIIGGRVISFFTERGLATTITRNAKLDKLAMTITIIALVGGVFFPASQLVGLVFLAAAIANGWRMLGWKSFQTLSVPLLWILHTGYAWIIIGMVIKGLILLGFGVPSLIATHAFTAGGIGTLTLGMMARVSLGHTGRPLIIGKTMVLAFYLINLAALCRVFGIWLIPAFTMTFINLAALFWFAAFGIFIVHYFPILIFSRLDGRDG